MVGTFVNAVSIIAGSMIGLLMKKGIPENCQTTVMQGLGMVVGVIGLQMAMKSEKVLIVIISIAVGGLIGEFLRIDKKLVILGNKIEAVVKNFVDQSSASGASLSNAFVTTTLIYCIGAMSIIGSIQDGLVGDTRILFAKSLIDGVTAIFFASSMGIGVAFSAISVFLYQGLITVMAGSLSAFLSDSIILEMTATGGVLIVGISLFMLKICEIRLANLLPAIVVSVFVTMFLGRFC